MPAETDAVPALEARDLTFSYGENADPVFSDLSLTVGRGEVVLVMGASGCGKSTLALCLAGGSTPPTRGWRAERSWRLAAPWPRWARASAAARSPS